MGKTYFSWYVHMFIRWLPYVTSTVTHHPFENWELYWIIQFNIIKIWVWDLQHEHEWSDLKPTGMYSSLHVQVSHITSWGFTRSAESNRMADRKKPGISGPEGKCLFTRIKCSFKMDSSISSTYIPISRQWDLKHLFLVCIQIGNGSVDCLANFYGSFHKMETWGSPLRISNQALWVWPKCGCTAGVCTDWPNNESVGFKR